MAELKINVTTNYGMFKTMPGNRKISKGHLFRLTKAIIKENLLSSSPIIVNEKMQIIDGQHRLEVARANKLPIYYIVTSGLKLQNVQQINSTIKAWTLYDYLESYASLGISEYQLLMNYYRDHKIVVSNLIRIFDRSHSLYAFKQGNFKIKDQKAGEEFIDSYVKLRPYTGLRVWQDRGFIDALRVLFMSVSVEEFITYLEEQGYKIEYRVSRRDYLRQFEEVINFRKSVNFKRLMP